MTSPEGVSAEEPVLYDETIPGVLVATINRPEARNALDADVWISLADRFGAMVSGARPRCLIVTGEGGFFSSGGDLRSGPRFGAGPMAPAGRLELAHTALERLWSLPVPTVAAVTGGAVGLGWSLALACDVVVADADAFFSAPFLTRGVPPDGGAAWQLVSRVGRHRAAELLYSGRRMLTDEAHRSGLVSLVSDPGGALGLASELASSIADADPGAVELTKRLLGHAHTQSFRGFLDTELSMATLAQHGDVAAAARADFP